MTTIRRKAVIVIDLETERKLNLHHGNLATVLQGVISEIGAVHDLTVYEAKAGQKLSHVFEDMEQDMRDGHLDGSALPHKGMIDVKISDETDSEERPGYDVDVFDTLGENGGKGNRREDLTRTGFPTEEEAEEYIRTLAIEYDVIRFD